MATDPLDGVFGALADPTRRTILLMLLAGDTTLTELASSFSISLPAVGRHLTVLEKAALISRGRVAQRRPCRVERPALDEAAHWLCTLLAAVQKMPGSRTD